MLLLAPGRPLSAGRGNPGLPSRRQRRVASQGGPPQERVRRTAAAAAASARMADTAALEPGTPHTPTSYDIEVMVATSSMGPGSPQAGASNSRPVSASIQSMTASALTPSMPSAQCPAVRTTRGATSVPVHPTSRSMKTAVIPGQLAARVSAPPTTGVDRVGPSSRPSVV